MNAQKALMGIKEEAQKSLCALEHKKRLAKLSIKVKISVVVERSSSERKPKS
jgi:hypothetical protein